MKKLTFLAGAALACALLFPGCSGDGFDEMNGTPDAGNPDAPAVEDGIRTLTVGMAEFGASGTRASFGDEADGKLPVFWDAEDRIIAYETVEEHAVGHTYKLVGSGGSGSGTITYDDDQTPPSTIAEIYYPAELAASEFAVPAAQTYTPGSFDPAAHVMRAEVGNSGEPIVFESKVSVACLRLTGDGEKVTSVRLDLTPSGGTTKSYTLACPGDGVTLSAEQTAFYIAVEGSATPCDAVFTISVDGVEKMVQKTTSAKTFAASTVVRLPVVAYQRNLYQIADYWPNDTAPEGIVFSVSEGGLHGKVLSLKELGTGVVWGPTDVKQVDVTGNDIYNVNSDSRTITRKIIEAHLSEADFETRYPGFNWIYTTMNHDNTDGVWYCPSLEELAQLCVAMSGLSWSELKTTWKYYNEVQMPGWESTVNERKTFKNRIDTAPGATSFNIAGSLYSTKETSAGGSAWVLRLDRDNASQSCLTQPLSKGDTYCRMRAVRTF